MEHRTTPSDRGVALVVVLMAMTLLMGLGAGLALLSATEARLAAHFAAGLETLYAAEAAIERVLPDLAATADWALVASGGAPSTFVDGGAAGLRVVADGRRLDQAERTYRERCGRPTPCGDDEAEIVWRLYAHAPMQALSGPDRPVSPVYVIVWVAHRDPASPDALLLRARGYGLYGARRGVDVALARQGTRLRLLSWREL
jgi:hypothetical protein